MKPAALPCQAAATGAAPVRTVTVTLGTAGHVDHGKTALVKLLTGCDCDTLPEERARGMTIDLGFAVCRLPDGRQVGIVDVPGHERFIHNMVAGASGIDAAILVIAADDGIMPQTLEHFHIVRLLGISAGFVALTKIDLVEPARLAALIPEIRALTAGSFLDGGPIVPVSAKTGAGFDDFYGAVVAAVDRAARREAAGAFRMHVEYAFVKQGIGTIVSGIPRFGTVRVGDSLDLLPDGGLHKVRGLQVYGAEAEAGRAGECIALRLGDLAAADVRRGMVLATPGYCTPTRLVDARLHLMPNLDRPLKPRSPVRFHVGTADVTGHLVFSGAEPPAPGSDRLVQVQLDQPVVAAPGDLFVIRSLSPAHTLGGGPVIAGDTVKLRARREDWVAAVAERERAAGDPAAALAYALQTAGRQPRRSEDLAKSAFLDLDTARARLAEMARAGAAIALPGGRYASAAAADAARAELVAALARRHDAAPLNFGFARKDVFPGLTADRLLTDWALARLTAAGDVRETAAGLALTARAPRLSPAQAGLADALRALFRKAGLCPPNRDEARARLGAAAAEFAAVLQHLLQAGELVALDDKVVLHPEPLDAARRLLLAHLEGHGHIDAATFRDLAHTSRKVAIPLLEYWDRQGLTKRIGDRRTLKGP